MARYRPRSPLRWPLDYSWGYRHWRWNVWSDVLLEAQPWTTRPAEVRAALAVWLAGKTQSVARVDGEEIAIAYEGGIRMHAEDRQGGQPAMSVYLHSSGEDAFDSIKWYADQLVDALLAVDPEVKVRWVKHPHKRHYLRETRDTGR
ncbi:hypothetical protein EBB59_03085 [Lysobacter pythonis]|uniref:Uncharacterized protein n=1 Tax=Solilutibacter pythonis TaxID=2483112 RepID=A0A3M2I3I4_9GAMM|nr:hypothetical protein [Lysobacter pythonis]RMH94159.1 hypothetical protein EBB59_03085 [Lysobacter pythonis]